MTTPSITLIGAGNIAWHLGHRLRECGFPIRQVFSRQPEKAARLASKLHAFPISRLEETDGGSDLYLLAVRDDAIAAVARQLASLPGLKEKLVAHLSGATPSTVLAPFFPHFGVLYPLQTFTAGRPVTFDLVPVCIDAAGGKDLKRLRQLAERISSKVYHIPDAERAVLHVAAVFANNFSNHLYELASEILNNHQLSFDLLRPLIMETAAKVQHLDPYSTQTGPAIRGDNTTIERHLSLLESMPDIQKLYLELTLSINNNLNIKK